MREKETTLLDSKKTLLDSKKIALLCVAVITGSLALAVATQATGASGPRQAAVVAVLKKPLTTKQINAMLPPEIRQKGVITVATSAAYPPASYLAADGQTIVGYVPDMVTVIGKAAGLRVQFVKTTFPGILTGIQAGRYDGGIVFADTKVREAQANILGLYNSGDTWVVRSSYSGPAGSPCGKSVGASAGSSEALHLPGLSNDCVAKGNGPLDVHLFANEPTVNIALMSGRIDAQLTATDIGGYSVARSNGELKQWGKQIDSTVALTGMALPQQPLSFAKALRVACQKLVNNGTLVGILKTWGVGREKVKNCYINGAGAGIVKG